jgi:excisionase family DNA binding protein
MPKTKTKPVAPTTEGALKLKESCAYLGGLSKPTLYRLVADGRLKPCRQLRHLLFTRQELDRFLNS